MKLTKKLFPAIGMLLLSACMLVTSTFAWFSMNENVTATNMSVTAVGDQVYLQIVAGDSKAAFQDGANQTTAQASVTSKALLPVNVVQSRVETTNAQTSEKEYLTCVPYGAEKDDVADYATIMWVTNIGMSNTVGTAKASYSDVTAAATNNNGKYFIKNTFTIRLDPTAGAEEAGAALNVAAIATNDLPEHINDTTEDFKDCLNVLVVSKIYTIAEGEGQADQLSATYGQVWECNDNEFTKKASVSADALSDGKFQASTYAVVEIYVFFNGDDADCTQAKLAEAKNEGYDVTVTFSVA